MKRSDLIAITHGKVVPIVVLSVALLLGAFTKTNGSVNTVFGVRLLAPRPLAQESKPTDIRELKQGESIDRELVAGTTHAYRIVLSPLQYMHVQVEQFGINVEVALSDSKGQPIASLDWWWRERTESLWALAESGGDYVLKISAPRQPAETGKYRVKIEKIGDWQQASARDRDYVNAHKLYA